MTVQAGMFAVVDAQGTALCHAPSQDKTANGKVRAEAKMLWKRALVRAGLAVWDANGRDIDVLCEDGIERNTDGASKVREGRADFGHIIANALGGAFCGCNAVPQEGSLNESLGDAAPSMLGWGAVECMAYAEAFRVEAIAAMTKTKRARVV